ncbi:ATP-binding cassette domain-containing protein [Rhizobium sp. TH2]|uniref:thiamine ABC transporter ATP-binding protein n=1 Tax=Rhizobium sp. TH2 TaxID=2775403 RepID=UPI002157F625|nr:ATP-binding cassette domain-containing protein [Rhizobium sp. TH2]UVC08428.1 ATP-binding cassette domain-containing protein [Rhizobium sp. TH2]
MTPEIRLDNVMIGYEGRRFVYDLALSGGGIVAVTGPSGAGKSTMFHLIAGFVAPDAGKILLDDADMIGRSPGERPLTYIFQDHNLFAHLDVATNIALGISPRLKLTSEQSSDISEALAKVGLAGFEKRMPQALSGGERQRVAFARALVRHRPFLLLDEPFASLDEDLRQAMGDLVVELQRETRMMVLMISHDIREIARIAGRVIEIRDGRIGFSGSQDEWLAARGQTR